MQVVKGKILTVGHQKWEALEAIRNGGRGNWVGCNWSAREPIKINGSHLSFKKIMADFLAFWFFFLTRVQFVVH
jgi:hypothetical protein